MRVAKIRRGSRYAEAGFTHVFRFDQGRVHDDKYDRIIAALKKIYGNRRWRGRYWAWETYYGRWTGDFCQYNILVRSPNVVTQVMLMI